jgi:hypothetical protein
MYENSICLSGQGNTTIRDFLILVITTLPSSYIVSRESHELVQAYTESIVASLEK